MAKKKMTRAQAAAARRHDDQQLSQNKSKKNQQQATIAPGIDSLRNQVEDRSGRRLVIFFIFLFIVMAIAAPFLVIFMSNLLGISGV